MDERPNPSDEEVPLDQWWGMAIVATVILAGLEFMVYRGLAPIERGEPAYTAAVWEPIALVYDLWGLGAAMSVIPAAWVCFAGIFAWQTVLRVKRRRRVPKSET